MREAMGGTWLFGIVILFIALFTAFLAYSISYTRAFNTKNEIINILERNEGYTPSDSIDCETESKNAETSNKNISAECQIYSKMRNLGYNYGATSDISCEKYGGASSITATPGYCITKVCTNSDDPTSKVYYKVTTFIAIKIPVINVTARVPISGETKTLYHDQGKVGCGSTNGDGSPS